MGNFYSIYSQGMARVAACTLPVALADPCENARRTAELIRGLEGQGVALAVFPELGLTGYSADDLFLQDTLINATLQAIEQLRTESESLSPVIVVGAPILHENRLYNCAVVLHRGHVLGVVPKSYLPNYREFYEKRHFASGAQTAGNYITLPGVNISAADGVDALLAAYAVPGSSPASVPDSDAANVSDSDAANVSDSVPANVSDSGAASASAPLFRPAPVPDALSYGYPRESVPFGPDLLFSATDVDGFVFHVEICEDMWVPIPPAARASLAGATIIANLSGSPITIGRAHDRELMIGSSAARYKAAYIYAGNGQGESTTDLTWDGQTAIFEMGTKLAAGPHFADGAHATLADIDLDALLQERIRQSSFDDNRATFGISRTEAVHREDSASGKRNSVFRTISFQLAPTHDDVGLLRPIDRFPFVPNDAATLNQDCYEAYNIQVSALCQRLRAIGQPKIVIGVSGGLDSTQALIVAARAMDQLGRPRTDILAYTLPGFATSDHTKSNAYRLGESLGVSFQEIDIRPSARQMLSDIGHPFGRGEEVYDVTFENVQAGLRTDMLFRLAGANNAIVLGTGDLSELALGWCTFGVGDHMSHYNVNAGVPKTLMQHLIRWAISSKQFDDAVSETLQSILDTEISPELVPARPGEEIQSTQAKIGPYELQDFTLYYLLRCGLRPSKIAFYQWHAWRDAEAGNWPSGIAVGDRHAYGIGDIRHWMELFYRRFFSQQFKRSTLPNGPKVSAGGTLSPRGDWRMPSDASGAIWLADLERVPRG